MLSRLNGVKRQLEGSRTAGAGVVYVENSLAIRVEFAQNTLAWKVSACGISTVKRIDVLDREARNTQCLCDGDLSQYFFGQVGKFSKG